MSTGMIYQFTTPEKSHFSPQCFGTIICSKAEKEMGRWPSVTKCPSPSNKCPSADFFTPFIIFFDKVENIMGKGENAGYQDLLLSPQCFQKASFPGSLKVGTVK